MIPFRGGIDLQHADDVAAAFIAAALAANDGAPVFDLHGDLVDVADAVEIITAAEPRAAGLLQVGTSTVPGRFDFDDAPLQSLVGELPKTAFADGIAASLAIFARQRDDGTLTQAALRADAGLA
jgi:nucleoside-diphosphate-sugar epimerase